MTETAELPWIIGIIILWPVVGLIGYVIGTIVDTLFYRKEINNPLWSALAGPLAFCFAIKSLWSVIKEKGGW